MSVSIPFRPVADTTNVAATTTSSGATLLTVGAGNAIDPSSYSVRIHNAGTTAAFVRFGDSSVTAATATNAIPIPAGGTEVMGLLSNQLFHRVIMGSGTATVYFTVGEGF